jgi:hypothetical protein
MPSRKWTISFVQQEKFKVGIVPAGAPGHLPLKLFFAFIKWIV